MSATLCQVAIIMLKHSMDVTVHKGHSYLVLLYRCLCTCTFFIAFKLFHGVCVHYECKCTSVYNAQVPAYTNVYVHVHIRLYNTHVDMYFVY